MQYKYVIFDKPKPEKSKMPIVRDTVTLFERVYDAEIVLQERPGLEKVYSIHLAENGETIGFYEDGRWVIELDPMDGEAFIAFSYFLNAYNKHLPMRGIVYE